MRNKLLTAAIAAAFVHTSHAQQAWTLRNCIDYALDNNVTILKNRVTEQSGEETLKQTKSALWPSLSFSTSHGFTYRPLEDGTSIRMGESEVLTESKKVTANSSYNVGMSWTVWNGGVNYKQVEAQKLANKANRLTTQTSELTIQEQIAQLYVQIMYTRESVKVSEELSKTAEQQYQRGQEMFAQGQISKADLVQLQAQWEGAQYDIVSNRTQYQNYLRQLKNLLQLDMNAAFEVSGNIPADEMVLGDVPSPQAVFAEALSLRPEIKNANLSIETADIQYDIAKRGYYPTIGVSAGVNDSHNTGSANTVADQLRGNLNLSGSINVSVPLWDQRKTKTNKAKARLQKTTAQLDLQDKKNALSSTIEQHWLNATNGQQKFLSAKTKAQSQHTSYELVNEQFKNGLKNVVDVLQSRDLILQAEQDMLQSKYTTLYNIAMLRFYQGESLEL